MNNLHNLIDPSERNGRTPLNQSDGITMLIAIGNETVLQFLQAQPTLAIQRDLALISDDDNDLLMR